MNHQLLPRTVQPAALLVGTDEVLLFTRKAILEKQGFTVCAIGPTSAIRILNGSEYQLIVACHTLTQDQANSLAQIARAQPSRPALLTFRTEMSPGTSPHPFDASVWSLATPEAFISKVNALMETQLQRSSPGPGE